MIIKEDEVLTLLDAVEFIRQLKDYELDVRKIGTNEFPKFRFKNTIR